MVTIIPGKRPVYWECTVDGHSKFWAATIEEIKDNGKTIYRLTRRWGAINTAGQRMEQDFLDRYDAEKALDRLIWDKESKGYKALF